MNKKILVLCLPFIFAALLFTGCKVEFPDDVASLYANADASQIQSSLSSGGGLSDLKDENGTVSQSTDLQTDSLVSSSTADETTSAVFALSDTQADGPDIKQPDANRTQSNEPSFDATVSDACSSAEAVSSAGKDQYHTDPVPQGKPTPVEPQNASIDKSKQLYCTVSVGCQTILDNMDKFNKDKLSVLPSDGVILSTRQVVFYEGESVFDVLLRETKKNRIHMEFVMTPMYNSNYIKGIHNLYEFDCGDLSGWMYRVNGWFPNYGCSRYQLHAGDIIEWVYTCDLGRDVGDIWTGKDFFSDGGK